ncbi:hypothetical protein AB0I28_07270 [Phytomonospora sp. NPDC050363]|uniref:hypothetical protein n=1 Tax=Phytomonospora sp. NPDC050363 TaxID=3155642 RepID=UPI00340BF597
MGILALTDNRKGPAMLRTFERISDRLLARIVPSSTASAEQCYFNGSYCIAPSNTCSCHACVAHRYICAGHETWVYPKSCC